MRVLVWWSNPIASFEFLPCPVTNGQDLDHFVRFMQAPQWPHEPLPQLWPVHWRLLRVSVGQPMIQLNWSNRLVGTMREIQASEAKVHLPQLLDEVERGETLIITRHGRPIARIVPEVDRRQEEIDKARAAIRELRKRTGRITLGELLSARDEGRKP